MNAPAEPARTAVPGVVTWVFLVLLVLPLDPFWLDAEQARRGLLLVLAGTALALVRPRAIVGERWLHTFAGVLLVAAAVAWLADTGDLPSFHGWDALFRIAHWAALFVAMRLGAASDMVATGRAFTVLLLVTSAFGLLQRLGLAEIAGHGVAHEPVSVFGNLNVAAEWTAVAAAVVATSAPSLTGAFRSLAWLAILLAGAYTLVNGSRSGLVALPLGLLLLAWLRRGTRSWLPLGLAVAGAAGGALLGAMAPVSRPVAEATPADAASRGANTLAVRLEIARSTLRLVYDDPVLGLGPGQFAAHYPRVRSQAEIELSSHGRQFASEVRTVHDDWLELLVDGGALGLLAFVLALYTLVRAQSDRSRLVPLVVLLALMVVRAPLWNAPAAVAAFWLVGTLPATREPRRAPWLAFALGALLIALGGSLLVGNHFAARYQQTHQQQPRDVASLQRAAWWLTGEPRIYQLLTQERLFAGDLDGASRAAAKALQLRPHDPQLHVHLGEVLARAGKHPEAAAVARAGLALDPAHPELRVLLSTVLCQRDDVDGAITAVTIDLHPVLRARLASHFRSLAEIRQREQPRFAVRYLLEHHVIAAIDNLGDPSPAGLAAATEHTREAMQAMSTSGAADARPWLLVALQLAASKPKDAEAAIARLAACPPLADWQRALFGTKLEPLLAMPGAREFLARRR